MAVVAEFARQQPDPGCGMWRPRADRVHHQLEHPYTIPHRSQDEGEGRSSGVWVGGGGGRFPNILKSTPNHIYDILEVIIL